jgi:hypothetical protein
MQAVLVDESVIEMDTVFHGDLRVDMYCNCEGVVKSSLTQRSFLQKQRMLGVVWWLIWCYVYVYVEEDEQSPGGGIKRRYSVWAHG